ncbi:hypothetical protein [Paenibacillus humicola]|uniref:hypothetical protein n=1 Tax=Paenibacillus humicola TaxID=3110540 RepID=UPI00237A1126|nr:hypothetical protein [Paenibacillus humicola]
MPTTQEENGASGALAAHLNARLGRNAEAQEAYDRAIGLCGDAAMRDFLAGRARQIRQL